MRLALARAALLDDVGLRGGEPTVRRHGLAAVARGRPGAEADLYDGACAADLDGRELAGLERRTRIVLDVVTLEGHSTQLDDLGDGRGRIQRRTPSKEPRVRSGCKEERDCHSGKLHSGLARAAPLG